MKKLLAVLVAAMLVIMGTVALAEGGTTLTIACWDLTTTPYYEAIKTAYEAANPDVTIEWVDLASQDYAVKTSTMLAGGDTPPDLYAVKELSDLQNWAKEGFVVNLDERIAADGLDMSKYAGMDTCYTYTGDGSYYALPFRADYWVMFYNKDIFDQAGVALPDQRLDLGRVRGHRPRDHREDRHVRHALPHLAVRRGQLGCVRRREHAGRR